MPLTSRRGLLYYDFGIAFNRVWEVYWQIKIKPVYMLFTVVSEVCFLNNQCITSRLYKRRHLRDEIKRSPFLIIPWCILACFILYARKEITFIYFTLNISYFERRPILLDFQWLYNLFLFLWLQNHNLKRIHYKQHDNASYL